MQNDINAIRSRMEAAAQKSGRTVGEITLLAVSKLHSAQAVQEASLHGLTLFGESRVQEAKEKIALLPSTLHWHFIGHLQRNKIRVALPLFECFHGVDKLSLASDMNRIAVETGLTPTILLEVNISGETSKFGFLPEILRDSMERLLSLSNLRVNGLMTMAPYSEDPETARPVFSALRELRDSLEKEYRVPLPVLSMGMSGDFEVAIEEGSTLVRVGSALFGGRT